MLEISFMQTADQVAGHLKCAPLHLEDATVASQWPTRHSEMLEFRVGERRVLVKRILRSRSAAIAAETVRREYTALVELQSTASEEVLATIPAPLALLPEIHALVETKLPGEPLTAILRERANRLACTWSRHRIADAGRRTGEWLRMFHTATRQPEREFPVERFLAESRSDIERLARQSQHGAALGALERDLVRAVRLRGDRPEPCAARHGDFVPQNVLIDRSAIGIVDFEYYGRTDTVMFDLGSFTSYLVMLATNPLYSRSALRRLETSFLDAYGALDLGLLALYRLEAAIRNAVELDVTTSRGRRRRQRFEARLVQLARELPALVRDGRG
jgi:hypothetical protein